jgi:phosphoglycerate-specific signal transduction histidine kinase
MFYSWTSGEYPINEQRTCHEIRSVPQFEEAFVVEENKYSFLKRTILLIIIKSNKSNCNSDRNKG